MEEKNTERERKFGTYHSNVSEHEVQDGGKCGNE